MKRTLILSLFLFGWLLILESCDHCGSTISQAICVQRNYIQAKAYNLDTNEELQFGESVLSSDLIIDVTQDIKEETCMRYSVQSVLMACSPGPRYVYNYGLEVEQITITSSATLNQDYGRGMDLVPLFEVVKIEPPVSGEPIIVSYQESSSAFLHYLYTANSIPHGYDPEYGSNVYRVIRFKEGVKVAKGEHTFTINWIMGDDSVLSDNITVDIQ